MYCNCFTKAARSKNARIITPYLEDYAISQTGRVNMTALDARLLAMQVSVAAICSETVWRIGEIRFVRLQMKHAEIASHTEPEK